MQFPNDNNEVFVRVVIPVPIEKPYTYAVPVEFQDKIGIGFRVEVQFGRSKRYAALIVGIDQEAPPYKTKSIIDDEISPYLSEKYQLISDL